MRNPNGFGTVVKLSGNRRNPYAVRKTVGWNGKGHPIYRAIGYAATRQEGLMMLANTTATPTTLIYIKLQSRKFTGSGLNAISLKCQNHR